MQAKDAKTSTGPEVPAPVTGLESRRNFLKSTALLGTMGTGGMLGSALLSGGNEAHAAIDAGFAEADGIALRARQAARIRIEGARDRLRETLGLPEQRTNADDARYAAERFYASFTKSLPHNRFGEVDPPAYRALLRAVRTGRPEDYDAIPLDPRADRKLANPQGALRFVYAGLDGHATRMRPAPSFRSAECAAEMGELYWQALTRDVPFNRYQYDPTIAAALTDLNSFSAPVGPLENGTITPATIFRGPTPGDLRGPYISQFLWKDVPWGPSLIEQRYDKPLAYIDFMIDEANWLNVQRGGNPLESISFDPPLRYIHDNRSLGEYVFRDVLFQAYFNAALILLRYGAPAIDSSNPYFTGTIPNQSAFTSLGVPWVLDLVTQAGNLSLSGAWYQKWDEHRRLRPESYGGRLHFMRRGERSYEIHPELLDCAGVEEAFRRNHSWFLPMAFTEGSPTHPSYPAGHATVAGACTTTLKAFFNEDFVIPDPVIANDSGTALYEYRGADLTVGGELDKLASNVAIGRNAAGVHYRSDGVDGLLIGEQQAIALLREYSLALSERFDGFTLRKFDGTRVHIRDGGLSVT